MLSLAAIRKRFIIFIVPLAIVNLALAVYLFRPGASTAAQQRTEAELKQQSRNLKSDINLLRTSNPGKTRTELAQFTSDHIPHTYSEISEELERLNQQAGVKATQGRHYTTDKTDLPDVTSVKIDTTVVGSYEAIAHFINALERSKMLFIITQIQAGAQPSGQIALQVKFQTFIRETA